MVTLHLIPTSALLGFFADQLHVSIRFHACGGENGGNTEENLEKLMLSSFSEPYPSGSLEESILV